MKKLFFDKIILWGIIVIVFAIPILFESQGFNTILIKTTFFHIGAISLFFLWIAKLITQEKCILKYKKISFFALLFLFSCIISFLFSEYQYASFRGLTDFFCYTMLFLTIINNVREKDINKILASFLISCSIVVLYGFLQYFGIDFVAWQRSGKIISSVGSSNFFAGYLIFAIPVVLGIFFASRHPAMKIFTAILSVFFVLDLVWTFARSSWIALLTALIIFILFKLFRQNKKEMVFMSIMIILLFAGFFVSAQFDKTSTVKEKIGSVFPLVRNTITEIPEMFSDPVGFRTKTTDSPGARITMWQGAYRMFLAKPVFGYGPGTLEVVFPQFRPSYYGFTVGNVHTMLHVHSEYLEILAEQGIFGIVTFMVFIFFGFSYILKKTKNLENYGFNICVGMICGCFVLLIEAVISVNMRWTCPAVFFWVFFGLLFPAFDLSEDTSLQSGKETQTALIPLGVRKIPVYFLLALSGFFLINNEIKIFISNIHLGRAVKFSQTYKRPDISVLECQESLKNDPSNIRALYYEGMSYFLLGQWNDAIKIYDEVQRFAPHYHQTDYYTGIAYFYLQKRTRAAASLQKAIELDESNVDALRLLKTISK